MKTRDYDKHLAAPLLVPVICWLFIWAIGVSDGWDQRAKVAPDPSLVVVHSPAEQDQKRIALARELRRKALEEHQVEAEESYQQEEPDDLMRSRVSYSQGLHLMGWDGTAEYQNAPDYEGAKALLEEARDSANSEFRQGQAELALATLAACSGKPADLDRLKVVAAANYDLMHPLYEREFERYLGMAGQGRILVSGFLRCRSPFHGDRAKAERNLDYYYYRGSRTPESTWMTI
ncbi:MAG: hypothetical protein KC910_22940 [Candidatus Eremiobacteraeota bacterium]|nr:hypothetical protein [Candidatus Eremiobacteraeota bacterium]